MKPAPPKLRYEIFWKLADRQAIWIETVESLEKAKRRIQELAKDSRGDYFVFDTLNVCFVVQNDAEPQ